jgi:radical SAM superfamily enzyme YgiQ (UPF0313 family)
LIDALEGKRELDTVLGLSCRDAQGQVKHNASRPPMSSAELDRVPWPRIELVQGFSHVRFPLNRSIYFTMLTRGCDQACNFCSITRVFGRALRHRTVGNIIEELGSRWDPGRQFLFLMDDSLAADKDFLKSFLEALIAERMVPRLGWHSQMRADVADDAELLRLLQATNCTVASCGFESVSDRSLRQLGKGQTASDTARAIRKLREHDVMVNGFFLLGTDHDGPEAFAQTVAFARDAGCTMAGFMPLTPYPGTPMWKKLEREGRIFCRDWELYDMQHVVVRPARMSAWELYKGTLACYPAFYGKQNPWREARRVLPHWPAVVALAIACTWPAARHLTWGREVIANLDYIRELRRVHDCASGRAFPMLSQRRLWAKDLLSGRTVKRLGARATGVLRRAV